MIILHTSVSLYFTWNIIVLTLVDVHVMIRYEDKGKAITGKVSKWNV